MHHDRVHAVSHGERLEVRLDGHREGQFIDEVHGCAGDDRTAAQVLEAEDCGTRKGNVDVMTGGHVMLEIYTYYLDATKKRQIFTVHISYSRLLYKRSFMLLSVFVLLVLFVFSLPPFF